MKPEAVVVGIDIGGTFTDIVASDDHGRRLFTVKIATTEKPEDALIEGVRAASSPGKPGLVLHSGTIATNTLLTHKNWPRVALVTTEGFRDVIEIGRMRRAELYNLKLKRPEQIVTRERRITVRERTDAGGRVLMKPAEAELETASASLRKISPGVVVVSFINSYANGSNEQFAAGFLRSMGFRTVSSSDIDPQPGEFERTSTAVVNAVLSPAVSGYISGITERLKKEFGSVPLYIMQSDGGLNTAADVVDRPVSMIESGPASGVVSALHLSRLTGIRDIITFDMGGTTAKAGVIHNGEIEHSYEFEAAGTTHSGRSIRGSGYTVRFPFIDLAETGAGGGSLAWLDDGGSLRVGPQSAGSIPGPACYGRAGREPTVTDANLLLNRLPGDALLGGAMPLDRKAAEDALSERLCSRLGTGIGETALGILAVANLNMSKILRIVSIERGLDPRGFSMLCFGGAGPLHAAELAEDIGIKSIIVPEHPGLFSALGLVVSDIRREYFAGAMKKLDELDSREISAYFEKLEEKAHAEISGDFTDTGRFHFIRQAMLRYEGQGAETAITLPSRGGWWKGEDLPEKIARLFGRRHRRLYGYVSAEDPVLFVSARLTAVGVRKKAVMEGCATGSRRLSKEAVTGWTEVWFGDEAEETPVVSREKIVPGNRFDGPALVRQYDTTTVIPKGWRAEMDRWKNIVLRRR